MKQANDAIYVGKEIILESYNDTVCRGHWLLNLINCTLLYIWLKIKQNNSGMASDVISYIILLNTQYWYIHFGNIWFNWFRLQNMTSGKINKQAYIYQMKYLFFKYVYQAIVTNLIVLIPDRISYAKLRSVNKLYNYNVSNNYFMSIKLSCQQICQRVLK